MKHKRDSSLDGSLRATSQNHTAEDLRELFAKIHPHVPLAAYDDFLAQYNPTPIATSDEITQNTTQSTSRDALRSSRKKIGDEMYEVIHSTDLKFLLPGDSLTVYSHKSFPEQFEFTMHYIDKATGELKSALAPHQTKLRAHLSIARPSGPMRASVAGPYNAVTFTAPALSTSTTKSMAATKSTLSGFAGSFFKKAGVLELLPELATVEIPERNGSKISFNMSSASTNSNSTPATQNHYATAPSTPTGGSPRNSSPASSSDDASIQSFVSSSLITSSIHAAQTSNSHKQAALSHRLMPVALSFRSRVNHNGAETIVASPLFIICDTVEQVDLFVCRVFKSALPASYPHPNTSAILDIIPPRAASSKRNSRSSESRSEKQSTVVEKSESKKSKSSSKTEASKSESSSKHESKHKRDSSKAAKAPSSGKSEASAPAAGASLVSGTCKSEVPAAESTSRFQALKFW